MGIRDRVRLDAMLDEVTLIKLAALEELTQEDLRDDNMRQFGACGIL